MKALQDPTGGRHDDPQLYLLNRDWRCLLVNDRVATVVGATVRALRGRSLIELFPGLCNTPCHAALTQAFEHGSSAHLSLFFEPWGGEVEVDIHPMLDGVALVVADPASRSAEDVNEEGAERAGYTRSRLQLLHSLAAHIVEDQGRPDIEETRSRARLADAVERLMASSHASARADRAARRAAARFVLTDLELSFALLDRMEGSETEASQRRHLAENAYITALQVLPRIELDSVQELQLGIQLARLRDRLEALGVWWARRDPSPGAPH